MFAKPLIVRQLLTLVFGLLLAGPVVAESRQVPESQAQIQLSFAPLVREAAPAVVNIYTKRVVEEVVRSPLFSDPFFKQFFGDRFGREFGPRRRRARNSLGSGVIVSADGLIITNHHVIDKADEITVALGDRREFPAELILDDERTDLAVLRIDTNGEALPFLTLRDSDELEVGDLVLAIGNPFNVGQTVTSGIVSALARTGVGVSDFQFFIQTDAAINPGNSGGALISMDGRLVGINTAIFSRSGGSHGIGFAVPTTMVRVVLESARQGLDYVQRPWFGAAMQSVDADIATSVGLERPHGALVRAIYEGGPADSAGIQRGDIVLAVDGFEIEDPRGLQFRLGSQMIGGAVTLDLYRGGSRRQVTLELVEAPEDPPRNVTELRGAHPFAGLTVANLSPALAEQLGVDVLARGVIVLKVARNSPSRRLRLRSGDRFIEVNGKPIERVRDLRAALDAGSSDWRARVQRGDRTLNLSVRG